MTDRLYVSRKKEGRGLASIEDYVDESIQGHNDYFRNSKERLITEASYSIGNQEKKDNQK